jgi:hypothetical protein
MPSNKELVINLFDNLDGYMWCQTMYEMSYLLVVEVIWRTVLLSINMKINKLFFLLPIKQLMQPIFIPKAAYILSGSNI